MVANIASVLKRSRQVGLSLVEFMVAILISMIVLAGVLQVMSTSKTTFLSQEEMSYIQENARFALDIIGRDIQAAGYLGCAGNGAELAVVGTVDANSAALLGPEPVLGFEGDAGVAAFPAVYSNRVRNIDLATAGDTTPDSIVVRRAQGIPRMLEAHTGTTINVDDASGIGAGDYVTVVSEDCRSAGIVRLASVATNQLNYGGAICGSKIRSQSGQSLICDATCNCTGGSGSTNPRNYSPGSLVQEYSSNAYFIGTSTAVANQPALKRMVLRNGSGVEEELALGVEDMEIRYGVDSDANGVVDAYLNADDFAAAGTDWQDVYAVQVSLVFRSQNPGLPEDEVQAGILENTYDDRFIRQVVTSTYRLRNRT